MPEQIERLKPFLYDSKLLSVPSVLTDYNLALRMDLKEHPSTELAMYLSLQELYLKLLINKEYLRRIRSLFNKLYDEISLLEIFFGLDGRRKSLLSYEKKVEKFLKREQGVIRDIFAFRITIFDDPNKSSEEMVELCYSVMERAIQLFSMNGCLPDEELNFQSMNNPYIRDYIANPKPNGYRGLHATMSHLETGVPFELQVKTQSMLIEAEYGTASHTKYKKAEYGCIYDGIDLSKVNLIGFVYDEEKGLYDDRIGLINSVNIITRHKTF